MLVKLASFAGIIPKTAPDKLPASAASIANNCRLTSGDIEPWRGFKLAQIVEALSSAIKTIYYYIPDSIYLTFTEDTDIVPSPVAQDQYGRIYMADATSGASMAISSGVSLDAFGRTQITRRPLGLDAPGLKPNVFGTGGSSALSVVRSALYTFVTDIGEEGPPSLAADAVTMKQDDTFSINGMSTTASNANVTKKRIYVTSVGSAGASYQFWAEVALATASNAGAIDPLNLGETLPSTFWTKAPAGLRGLVALAGNFMAGFVGNEVWFCEPGYPHAWPVKYMLTFNDDVVGLGVDGSTLIVLTNAMVYIVSAPSPDTASVSTFPDVIPCVAKRSIAMTPAGVIFASEDGLYAGNSAGVAKISQDYWTRAQWQDLNPSTMHAAYQNGYYIFFHSGGRGVVVAMPEAAESRISELDFYATATGAIKPSDELAIAYPSGSAQNVSWFDADTTFVTSFLWRSRLVIAPEPVNFSCARVTADEFPNADHTPDPPDNTGGALGSSMVGEYSLGGDWWTSWYAGLVSQQSSLTLRIYAGGDLKHTSSIVDDSVIMLPSGFLERKWEVSIEGNVRVQSIQMATSVTELMTGPLMPGASV